MCYLISRTLLNCSASLVAHSFIVSMLLSYYLTWLMIAVPYCVNLVLASCPNVRCVNVAFLLSDLANDSNASVLIWCRLLKIRRQTLKTARQPHCFFPINLGQVIWQQLLTSLFGCPPNLCYDAVVETLSTINNTSLPKSPSESVQYPLS